MRELGLLFWIFALVLTLAQKQEIVQRAAEILHHLLK